jgi:hypothetical protein
MSLQIKHTFEDTLGAYKYSQQFTIILCVTSSVTTCFIYGNKYAHRYGIEYGREEFTTMSMMLEKRVLPERSGGMGSILPLAVTNLQKRSPNDSLSQRELYTWHRRDKASHEGKYAGVGEKCNSTQITIVEIDKKTL